MQAYSSTLLQFIFKFQLVYFPYFYDDKVQKKCTNLVHSCNQMVHSYFARYSPNRKILAKNARYLPFLSDICLYLPKSHNWGGIWKQWKKPRTRVENLKKLGMPDWQAYRNGNTRKGYWAVAGSGILTHTITNERLARRGYYDISEAYKSLHCL